MKKRISIVIVIALLFLFVPFYHVYGNNAFTIPSYKIDIQVDKSAVFDVVETIQIENCEDLTIYKNILKNYQYDVEGNGHSESFAYGISDIKVENAQVSISHENDVQRLTITLKQPTQEITLRYKVRMRNFQKEDGTVLLLYNLLHPSFEATIEQLQATITLPNSPETAFNIYTTNNDGSQQGTLNYQLQNKTLHISSMEPLKSGTGIMMQANLRNFYFTYSNPTSLHLYMSILSILVVMGSYFVMIYYPRFRNKKVLKECYPLENMEIGSLGYILDGVCEQRDIMAIIIEWANQNYIQIRDENQTVSLCIVNELPVQALAYEKHLFNLIFTDYTMVTIDQLKVRNLAGKLHTIENEIYEAQEEKSEHPIYTKSSYLWQISASFFVSLPMCLTMFACKYEETYSLFPSLIAGLISIIAIFLNCLPWVWILKNRHHLAKNTRDVYQLLISLINFICGGLFYQYLLTHNTAMVYITISIILTILFACILIIMEKKTYYGRQLTSRLLSLRGFIRRAGVTQLNNLLYDNPYYFEDMLPYVYVFDIIDIWGKKFTSIPLQAPFWFYHASASANSTIYWMSSLEKTLEAIRTALYSEPLTEMKKINKQNIKKKPKKKVKKNVNLKKTKKDSWSDYR